MHGGIEEGYSYERPNLNIYGKTAGTTTIFFSKLLTFGTHSPEGLSKQHYRILNFDL